MYLEDTLLMMPGPVPAASRVPRVMSKPLINHRSAEFAGIYTDCREILADVFQTKNDIFVLSGSGTAGMEAAVGYVAGAGNKVIAIENGNSTVQQLEIVLNKRGYLDSVGAGTECSTGY